MTSLRLRRDLADQLGEVLAPHLPAEPWVPAPGRPDVLLRQALVDRVLAAGWRPSLLAHWAAGWRWRWDEMWEAADAADLPTCLRQTEQKGRPWTTT